MRGLRPEVSVAREGTETTPAAPGRSTRTQALQRRASAPADARSAPPAAGGPDTAADDPFGFHLHAAPRAAAHAVPQGGAVQLAGGVGHHDDAYERHADAVADRVVAGKSAADLLATLPTGGGAARPAVQLRRLPGNAGTLLSNPADATQGGANFAANAGGMKRLIAQAARELSPGDRPPLAGMLGGEDWEARVAASNDPQFITQVADAIRSIRPDLTLGDPALIDVGPAAGSDDEGRLASLVTAVNTLFDQCVSGHDADLAQVFGEHHVAQAKARYGRGKQWMNTLHGRHRIVTDRSGYNAEVGLGGLTAPHAQIALAPEVFDRPGDAESKITLLHESMHAGNSEVVDWGYPNQPSFTQLPAQVKLDNASHYEVTARRIMQIAYAFDGETFTPAGARQSNGTTAPVLTDAQQAIRRTSELFREAWTNALNLHQFFREAYTTPARWNHHPSGHPLSRALPYWSKVMKATVHEKTDIDPSSADPARRPVSQIDMALVEHVTRKMSQAMESVPGDEPALTALEDAFLNDGEKTAARASVDARATAMIRLALRSPAVGEITGPIERDLRVVDVLGRLDWSTVLNARDPGSFAD